MFTDRRHGELAFLVVTFAVSSIDFQKHLTLREMVSQMEMAFALLPQRKAKI